MKKIDLLTNFIAFRSKKGLVMRVFIFLFLFVIQVFAKSYAQKTITINSGNSTLGKVIKEIETQSSYHFYFSNDEVDINTKVNLIIKDAAINKVMEKLLFNLPFEWKLLDNQMIVIKLKQNHITSETNDGSPPNQVVTGLVTDDNGNPLQGVTISEKGTNNNVLTDRNGVYKITLRAANASIIFNYIGYAKQTIKVTTDFLNVTLKQSEKTLDDVVVIGYGTIKKKDATGSMVKVDMGEMQKAPVSSFDQALAGRVAGVVVSSNDGQPGAASQIKIRGSSYSQDASPLYVIDGFPIENMDINSLNPADIESMEILKDASAIAIYGSRAANGVIMITTKTGKAGKPRITFNSSLGTQHVIKTIPVMGAYQFVKLQLELDSIASTPSSPRFTYHNLYLDPALGINLDYYKNVPSYNWQDLMLRQAPIQNNTLSIAGGSPDVKYLISGSAFNQQGVIINTGLKRYTGSFTLDLKVDEHFKVGILTHFANTNSYGTVPTAANGGGVVQAMWQYRPAQGLGENNNLINSLVDSTALSDFLDGSTSNLGNNLINPLIDAKNEINTRKQNTTLLNAFVEYGFWKNFKFKVSGGYNTTEGTNSQFYNEFTNYGNILLNTSGAVANVNGINGSIKNVLTKNCLNEDILSYQGKINSNNIVNIVGGFTYQYSDFTQSGFSSLNIPPSQEVLGLNSLGAGFASLPSRNETNNQLLSFLTRINYSLDKKYLFTVSMREDGSSKFAIGHQWGYFPSGAFAWRFIDESFLKKYIGNIINEGKLRVSYGNIGNNRVPDINYAWAGSTSNANAYATPNGYVAGLVPYFYGNPNLTWETTKELDLGTNMSFLNDRISVDADYYDKMTTNFLMSVTLPALAGYTNGLNQQYQNTGAVSNRGFEFAINTLNISSKKFSWKTNFNISFNKNKILQFYNNVQSIATNWGLNGAAQAFIAKTDGPLSEYYGYMANGLYQYKDFNQLPNGSYILKNGIPTYSANVQPGDQKYADINHDGVIDANDQTILGSYFPKHTGGITNIFQYKSFSLSLFVQWSYGNKVLNANRVVFETTGSYFAMGNQFASYENRWTPYNTNTDIPRALPNTGGDVSSNKPKPSSRFIEDGSYIRLKTINFNYEIPTQVLRRINLNRASVYVAAQNLFTITRYSGIDPEVSTSRVSLGSATGAGNVNSGIGYSSVQPSSGTPILSSGYDYTPYPRARTITVGINVNL